MAEEAYFYGAPGTFNNGATTEQFTPEQFQEAAEYLQRAIEATQYAQPAASIRRTGPSWASIAASKPAKGGMMEAHPPSGPSSSNIAALPLDTRANCVFYLNGSCRFGEACRFRHVKPMAAGVEFFAREMQDERSKEIISADISPATLSLLADLRATDEIAAPAAAEAEQDAAFTEASDAWVLSAMAEKDRLLQKAVDAGVVPSLTEAETALQVAERNLSASVTCGICFEHIVDTPGGRFGLLTGCTHPYCLECIRQWRARVDLPKETVRTCPLCRLVSYFVIPCDRYITDPARKAAVNSEYHTSQKAIPCRYFDQGRGPCPFGSSCRYAHINPDGTYAESVKPAIRLDSEGSVTVGRSYRLNEFLSTR
jgi:hypothetical protein